MGGPRPHWGSSGMKVDFEDVRKEASRIKYAAVDGGGVAVDVDVAEPWPESSGTAVRARKKGRMKKSGRHTYEIC